MATRALDIATILHALSVLSDRVQARTWKPINEEQTQLFQWLRDYGKQLANITGLEALASQYYEELNRFLSDRNFTIRLSPFNPEVEIGVVSILDKLVRWLQGPGEIVQIHTEQGIRPGFELRDGANVYEVEAYPDSHLVRLQTKSQDTLWLFVHPDTSLEGLDMVKLSLDVMNRKWLEAKVYGSRYRGVQVPMVDFDVQPSLGWLQGAEMLTDTLPFRFVIKQAVQQFKLRMDETGARVRVATGITLRSLTLLDLGPFVVDRPFYGWWTQEGVVFPMAAFFADWDSLRKPSGSLENL